MTTNTLLPELEGLKTRLTTIWTAGDYDRFSRYMEGGAREFYERLQCAPGCRLLDVGCGSGQLALLAAKDGVEVTGVDIAANSVERARVRAYVEGVGPDLKSPMPRRFHLKRPGSMWCGESDRRDVCPEARACGEGTVTGLCSWRHPRHGQLDGRGICRTVVQERGEIHRAVKDAVAVTLGE